MNLGDKITEANHVHMCVCACECVHICVWSFYICVPENSEDTSRLVVAMSTANFVLFKACDIKDP